MDASNNLSHQKYGRDILLQLRMHPLSLKKPDIQKLDIVKDKLYLHQLNNHNNTQAVNVPNGSPESFYGPMKFETDKFCCHRNYQDFFPWRCSFNGCGKKVSTAAHHGMLPCKKWQFSLPNYVSPLRKNCLTLSDGQYNSSMDDDFTAHVNNSPLASWSKQYCTTYDPQPKAYPKADMKSEKKVLPIIDPTNGKNILDGYVKKTSPTEDNTKEEDSVVTKSQSIISEMGDHSLENEQGIDNHNLVNPECGDIVEITKSEEGSLCLSQSESKEFCELSSAFDSSCEKKVEQYCENNSTTANSYEESEKEICKESDNKFNLNESVEKFDNQHKLNLMFLKEKLFSMKKEQQKMSVLQNFLRFKKHQIDESMRNLDEKKIEIANWECNLLNKAKELQEKECWLETKNLTLQNKALKLEEKERELNRKESFLNDKPKLSSKADVEEQFGTENGIDTKDLINPVHESHENNCEYLVDNVDDGSINKLDAVALVHSDDNPLTYSADVLLNSMDDGSLNSDKSVESSVEKSSIC